MWAYNLTTKNAYASGNRAYSMAPTTLDSFYVFFFIASLRNFIDFVFGKTTSFGRSLSQATFDDAGICNLQMKCFFYHPSRFLSPASVFS